MNAEIIGYLGTAIGIVAYGPQIVHLWRFQCAWGISLWSWAMWLVASLLLLAYAIVRSDPVFMAVQIFSTLSILITIILSKKRSKTCPYHLLENHK